MAIDCKELMIGDWVFCNSAQCNVQVKAMPINGVYGKGYRIIIDNDGFELVFREKHFGPIPLTAEILEKNEFVYRIDNGAFYAYSEESYSNQQVEIILFDVKSEYRNVQLLIREQFRPQEVMIRLMTCNFVHELQHALRLCGINKEIKL